MKKEEEDLKEFYEEELETDEERKLREERHEKELVLFKQNYARYGKLIKTVFGAVFGALACVFILLGMACLIIGNSKGEIFEVGVVYSILGAVWLTMFVVFMLAPVGKLKDANKTYSKYRNSVFYNMSVYPSTINHFQQKVELDELKQKVKELTEEVNKLKNKKI